MMRKIFCFVVGIVLLVSGFGKILDVTKFAFLIDSYGLGWAVSLAPVIVVVEVATGVLLIFCIQLRRVSLFAILLLTAFTIAYGYGYWMHGVENCGCFGVISRIKTPFLLVLLRNAVLIYFMIETFRQSTLEPILLKWKPTVILSIIVFVTFMSGLNYYPPVLSFTVDSEHKMIGKSITNVSIPVSEYISSDSSYIVFVFSYSCPHCWNSIENLKQYADLPEVDRIIGVTSSDTINSDLFQMQFNPQFTIYAMEPIVTESIVNAYPTTFYIRDGFIKHVVEGELPCAYYFKKMIENIL